MGLGLGALLLVVCALSGSATSVSDDTEETFAEELFIKPLPTGHLYSYFQFTTLWNEPPAQLRHFNLFPRPVGEIVEKHSLQELHVSLTQGLWRSHKWGYPVRFAGPGAEVSALFQPHLSLDEVDANWLDLVNSLSGLFCSSFNFVTLANTIAPVWSFGAEGVSDAAAAGSNRSTHARYAHLPREIVCTENLTPWKKLLPCESHSGLGELLDAKNVYDSNYHSLALDLRPVCAGGAARCVGRALELKMSLSLVTEPIVLHGHGASHDWSFKSSFGGHLFSTCPRASLSKIYIDVTSNKTTDAPWNLLPAHYETLATRRGGVSADVAVFDLRQATADQWPLNVRAVHKKMQIYGLVPEPLVHATRFVGGHGQEKGKLITRVHNNYYSSDIEIVHLELVPWYCRVYIHTLTISNSKDQPVRIDKMHFRPGLDRQRPHHLELRLKLPARSVTQIEWQFQKGFLKWTEYPPDAHRGFDLGPAVISALLPVARNWTGLPPTVSTFQDGWNVSSEAGYLVRLHTESLVVAMATPDFSMPYNVICLVCTVVALAFGPLFNLTTKRLVLKESTSVSGSVEAAKQQVKDWIRRKVLRRKAKND